MKKFLCVTLVITLFVSVIFVFAGNKVTRTFINSKDLGKFENENSFNVAWFCNSAVNYNNNKSYFFDILADNVLDQVYCIKNDNIYYSYQYKKDNQLHWCLAFTKFGDNNVNLIFDEIFDYKKVYSFNVDVSSDYKNRNGYYYDNKIILTDYSKLVEYDLLSTRISFYQYEEYDHPKNKIQYEISEDNLYISIKKNNDILDLDLNKFSDMNNVAKYVINNYNRKTLSKLSTFYSFFDDVQIVDNKVYLICEVSNFGGHAYNLLFTIDMTSKQIKYISWHYSDDPGSKLYIIPVIDDKPSNY